MGTISFWLSFVYEWGGVCIDALNVASHATTWGDWLSTGPLLVFIIVTIEEKSDLSRMDWSLMAAYYTALLSAFLMVVQKSYESGVFWFAVMLATVFPVACLPIYKKLSVTPIKSTRLSPYRCSKQAKVARLLAINILLFTMKYFAALFEFIDVAQTLMIHQVLTVLCKGIFVAGCMDIKFELLVKSEREFYEEKQANANRRAFMKYLFHEVRTPLNSLSLGIDMLRVNGAYNERTRDILINVNESVEYLNNVLLIQKIEEGKLNLEMSPFSILSAITAVLATLESASTSKNIVFKTSFSPLLPLNQLIGDKHRIQQVILNLVSNAIKFSPNNGKISIELTCGEKPTLEGRIPVSFSVTDEGCGIDDDEIQKLFSEFVQVIIF
jgi:signal transduction histidine kinase